MRADIQAVTDQERRGWETRTTHSKKRRNEWSRRRQGLEERTCLTQYMKKQLEKKSKKEKSRKHWVENHWHHSSWRDRKKRKEERHESKTGYFPWCTFFSYSHKTTIFPDTDSLFFSFLHSWITKWCPEQEIAFPDEWTLLLDVFFPSIKCKTGKT